MSPLDNAKDHLLGLETFLVYHADKGNRADVLRLTRTCNRLSARIRAAEAGQAEGTHEFFETVVSAR